MNSRLAARPGTGSGEGGLGHPASRPKGVDLGAEGFFLHFLCSNFLTRSDTFVRGKGACRMIGPPGWSGKDAARPKYRNKDWFMSSRERMTKVLGLLVLSVTGGAIILRFLQPAPLLNVTAFSLAAAFNPIQQIFETRVPVDAGKWQYIEIHQSGGLKGNARSLAELGRREGLDGSGYHFVITNGRGGPDGKIQVSQQWTEQKAERGYGIGQRVSSAGSTIRICLIGDFQKGSPGPMQLSQLKALLQSLQQRCVIPSRNISLAVSARAGARQWRLFPLAKLRQELQSNS